MTTTPIDSDYSGNTSEMYRMTPVVEFGSPRSCSQCAFKPTVIAFAMLPSKDARAPLISTKLLGPPEGYMASVLSSKEWWLPRKWSLLTLASLHMSPFLVIEASQFNERRVFGFLSNVACRKGGRRWYASFCSAIHAGIHDGRAMR